MRGPQTRRSPSHHPAALPLPVGGGRQHPSPRAQLCLPPASAPTLGLASKEPQAPRSLAASLARPQPVVGLNAPAPILPNPRAPVFPATLARGEACGCPHGRHPGSDGGLRHCGGAMGPPTGRPGGEGTLQVHTCLCRGSSRAPAPRRVIHPTCPGQEHVDRTGGAPGTPPGSGWDLDTKGVHGQLCG